MRSFSSLFVASLALACSDQSAQQTPSEEVGSIAQAFSTASISASPNPCLTANGGPTCTSTIAWTSTYAGSQQIWVRVDGAAPTSFACLPSGSTSPAPWIQPSHSYRFTLHPSASCTAGDRGVEAANVIVRGYTARITASANPCSAQVGGSCTTTVGWASGHTAPQHQLWRTGGSVPVACGPATSAGSAQSIPAGATYHYDLYKATSTACNLASRGALVASLDVSATATYAVKAGTGLALAGSSYRQIGMNKHELIMQALGAEQGSWQTDLQDAAARGIKVIRTNAAPYWPIHFQQWVNPSTRAAYWAQFDAIVSYAGSHGIKLIPSFLWNTFLYSDAVGGERLHAMFALGSPSSGRDLLHQYVQEFVTRYTSNSTILFWELTNELNLLADLRFGRDFATQHIGQTDPPGQLGASPNLRSDLDNYSTDEMVAFVRDLATRIKQWDTSRHLISTGYGDPRPSAMHLRRTPEWSASGPDWTLDTPAEMRSYVALTHPDPIDIVTVHVYSGGENDRFGATGLFNPDVIADYAAAADAIGKPMHLGEFGDNQPTVSIEPRANFTRRAALKALDLRLPVATAWTWKWLRGPGNPDAYSIYPGTPLMDDLITFMGNANTWLSTAPAARSTVLGVVNANFTDDADANGVPDGWTATVAGAVSIVDAPSPSFDGKTAYLFRPSGNGVSLYSSTTIPITAGNTVIVSAGVRPDLGAGGSAQFGLEQIGAGLLTVLPLTTDTAFRVRAFKLVLPSGTTAVRPYIYTTGQGKLYIDDFRVSKL